MLYEPSHQQFMYLPEIHQLHEFARVKRKPTRSCSITCSIQVQLFGGSEKMVPPSSLDETLIPGLPNDVGALILAFVPYSHQSRLRSVCKSWWCFLSSKTLIHLRQKNLIASELLCIVPTDPSVPTPYLFDPKNRAWCPLPPMPFCCNPSILPDFVTVSVGPHLYVLGGHLCTLPFPLDRPSPSPSAFRFDFATFSWHTLAPMITPRGSFACAAMPEHGKIVVAGGISTHPVFGVQLSSVELYDIEKDEWVALDGLPSSRVGCTGLFIGGEFWVMGGFGEAGTVVGAPWRDAVVMEFRNGGKGKWREVRDMWEEGEREWLGRIIMVNDGGFGSSMIFMLDKGKIYRYNMSSNRWSIETYIPTPRKVSNDSPVGFVALDGELHLLAVLTVKGLRKLLIRIYHPRKKAWRFLLSKPCTKLGIHKFDFEAPLMSTIQL